MLNHAKPSEMHKAFKTSTPVPILMYHSISNQASPRLRKYTITPELFGEHVAFLAEHHYTSLTVTQFVNALANTKQELPERPVIITFDDGFSDFYINGLPMLKRYDFTATLYIATAFVGAQYWLSYEDVPRKPMLDWYQIAEINATGIECGAHGHNHSQLDMLSETVARDEIVHCKRVLEERIGQEVSSFSYPFGHYTPDIRRWVRAAGYSSACSVKNAISSTADDPFSLARLVVTADTSVSDLATMLTDRRLLVTDPRKEARVMAMQLLRSGTVHLARYSKAK